MSRYQSFFTEAVHLSFGFIGGFLLHNTIRQKTNHICEQWATHYNTTYQNEPTRLCYQGIIRGEPEYQGDHQEEHI